MRPHLRLRGRPVRFRARTIGERRRRDKRPALHAAKDSGPAFV